MSDDSEAAARVSLQGNYSGAVSRLVAYLLDISLASALFTLALAGTSYVVSVITGKQVSWNRGNIVVAVVYFVWLFLYFAYSWATTGKTIGMAALGIRVVGTDGSDAGLKRAVVRTLVLPISVVLFWLSLPLILLQREHRAPHDLVAGTAVVYAWDARAAKWRLLARAGARERQAPAAQPSATGDATAAGQPES